MIDAYKTFFKSFSTLFPNNNIGIHSGNHNMNGTMSHSIIIEATLPIKLFNRLDAFEKAMSTMTTGVISEKIANVTKDTVAIKYVVYLHPDLESFIKDFNEKVSWHVFSEEFDAAVEEELVRK